MPKFLVKMKVVEEYEVEVEALSAEDAEQDVMDNWCAGMMPCFVSDTTFEVKEIK
jgi:hypothetical protein